MARDRSRRRDRPRGRPCPRRTAAPRCGPPSPWGTGPRRSPPGRTPAAGSGCGPRAGPAGAAAAGDPRWPRGQLRDRRLPPEEAGLDHHLLLRARGAHAGLAARLIEHAERLHLPRRRARGHVHVHRHVHVRGLGSPLALHLGAGEVGDQPVEVLLLPARVVGVIVALGALDVQAQEQAGGGAGHRLGPAAAAAADGDEGGGAVVAQVAGGGQQRLDQAVVAPVLVEGGDQEAARILLLDPLRPLDLPQQIAVDVGPVLGELGAAQQAIDQLAALVGAGVGQVRAGLGQRRDAADEIQRDPAQVLAVAGGGRGGHAGLAPVIVQQAGEIGRCLLLIHGRRARFGAAARGLGGRTADGQSTERIHQGPSHRTDLREDPTAIYCRTFEFA